MKNSKVKNKKIKVWIIIAAIVVFIITAMIIVSLLVILNWGEDTALEYTSSDEYYSNLAATHDEINYNEETGECFVNNRIIVCVDVKSDGLIEEIADKYNGSAVELYPEIGWYVLNLDKNYSENELDELVSNISAENGVSDVFMDNVMYLDNKDESYMPSDPWNGDKWDDVPDGDNWNFEAVNVAEAWKYREEFDQITVGVFEQYFGNEHEDLKFEYEYVQTPKKPDDDNSHFLMVSGIIGATWNNDIGINGILGDEANLYVPAFEETKDDDEEAKKYDEIHNEKFGKEDYDSFAFIMYAINKCLAKDAYVINFSQGYADETLIYAASQGDNSAISKIEKDAYVIGEYLQCIIEKRKEKGEHEFVICAAAGNTNDNCFINKTYFWNFKKYRWGYTPVKAGNKNAECKNTYAKYSSMINAIDNPLVKDCIIVVGAVNMGGYDGYGDRVYHISDFSDLGERVDVLAPGEDIYTLTLSNGYTAEGVSGTSFAAPHVSGEAGMLFALNPDFAAKEVKDIIINNTNGSYDCDGKNIGIIDIGKAVKSVVEPDEEMLEEKSKGELIDFQTYDEDYYRQYVEEHTGEYILGVCVGNYDNTSKKGAFVFTTSEDYEDYYDEMWGYYGSVNLWYVSDSGIQNVFKNKYPKQWGLEIKPATQLVDGTVVIEWEGDYSHNSSYDIYYAVENDKVYEYESGFDLNLDSATKLERDWFSYLESGGSLGRYAFYEYKDGEYVLKEYIYEYCLDVIPEEEFYRIYREEYGYDFNY